MKKVFISILLIITVVATVLPAAAAPITAKDYLAIGTGLYNSGKYDEAIKNFDLGLKLEPKNTEILLKKADALYGQLKFSDMAAVCDTVIGINGSVQAYYRKGLAMMALIKRNDALALFDKVISVDPKHPEVYKKKAIILILDSRFQDAFACLDLALGQNPADSELYAMKGECFLGLAQYPEATAAFLQFFSANPDVNEYFLCKYYYMLGATYWKQNDLTNCFVYLRKAMDYSMGVDFDLETNPLFSGLETNTEFLEIIGDQKSLLEILYHEGKILSDPLFDTISFLPSQYATDSDKSIITGIKDSFINSLYAGNIYNETTATQYGLSPIAAQRIKIINFGRYIKKMALLGLQATFVTDSYQILYVGKYNGQLKAAIVSIKGHSKVDGIDGLPGEDIYLFFNNNGLWQNYGLLNY